MCSVSCVDPKDKIIKIEELDKDEIKQDSEEWKKIYSYIIEPLDTAIKAHCEILKKNKRSNSYMKSDARDFLMEYINALNKVMPDIEKESKDKYKITIHGITVRYNNKDYTLSADMSELLAGVLQKRIFMISPFSYVGRGSISQYIFFLLQHNPTIQDLSKKHFQDKAEKMIEKPLVKIKVL